MESAIEVLLSIHAVTTSCPSTRIAKIDPRVRPKSEAWCNTIWHGSSSFGASVYTLAFTLRVSAIGNRAGVDRTYSDPTLMVATQALRWGNGRRETRDEPALKGTDSARPFCESSHIARRGRRWKTSKAPGMTARSRDAE